MNLIAKWIHYTRPICALLFPNMWRYTCFFCINSPNVYIKDMFRPRRRFKQYSNDHIYLRLYRLWRCLAKRRDIFSFSWENVKIEIAAASGASANLWLFHRLFIGRMLLVGTKARGNCADEHFAVYVCGVIRKCEYEYIRNCWRVKDNISSRDDPSTSRRVYSVTLNAQSAHIV